MTDNGDSITLLCSWCGEDEAIGVDHWLRAPTCLRCSELVVIRPFGWGQRAGEA